MALDIIEDSAVALETEEQTLERPRDISVGAVSGKTAPDFIERFAGIFANEPAFEAVIQYSEARRERERREAERNIH